MNPTQTEKENRIETADKPAERFAHTNQEKKRSENRRRASQYMKDLNRRNAIGDMLYMVGFWVEYVGVCVRRKVSTVMHGITDTVLNLLLILLRPILIGLITLIEDLTGPFVRIASGIRHIRELPAQLEDSGAGEVRAAKARYLASGIRKYSVLLWNAITYILPAVAAAALVVVVRGGLGLHFVLNVQVDGEHVGAVESEQVFENAREDVQSRINTAKRMLLSPETRALSWTLVMIHNGVAILLWPAGFVLPNALRAANDVRFTMLTSILSMIVWRMGLSWVLCVNMGMGAVGVWLAMVVDWICRVTCFVIRFASGAWQKSAVKKV